MMPILESITEPAVPETRPGCRACGVPLAMSASRLCADCEVRVVRVPATIGETVERSK